MQTGKLAHSRKCLKRKRNLDAFLDVPRLVQFSLNRLYCWSTLVFAFMRSKAPNGSIDAHPSLLAAHTSSIHIRYSIASRTGKRLKKRDTLSALSIRRVVQVKHEACRLDHRKLTCVEYLQNRASVFSLCGKAASAGPQCAQKDKPPVPCVSFCDFQEPSFMLQTWRWASIQ
eukprot:scaffold2142_cov327-Pavlova_lutheri.AAC.6